MRNSLTLYRKRVLSACIDLRFCRDQTACQANQYPISLHSLCPYLACFNQSCSSEHCVRAGFGLRIVEAPLGIAGLVPASLFVHVSDQTLAATHRCLCCRLSPLLVVLFLLNGLLSLLKKHGGFVSKFRKRQLAPGCKQ